MRAAGRRQFIQALNRTFHGFTSIIREMRIEECLGKQEKILVNHKPEAGDFMLRNDNGHARAK